MHEAHLPKLSIIAVFFDMQREAPRTLFTLSPQYQKGVDAEDYEVIVIDNGSTLPIDHQQLNMYGENFRYYFYETSSPSPVEAINFGASLSKGRSLAVLIDGARMLSPGLVHQTLQSFKLFENPFVCSLAWHLGEVLQNDAIKLGYKQQKEDELLETVDWHRDGYQLFSISCLAASSGRGWFHPISESNFFAVRKDTFTRLGGYDPQFQSPGGGLANHDFYLRCSTDAATQLVHILGEGTFHQYHGGVATNVVREEHPFPKFREEYLQVRNKEYVQADVETYYLGSMHPNAVRFIRSD